jgi:uncharacterized membrane protein
MKSKGPNDDKIKSIEETTTIIFQSLSFFKNFFIFIIDVLYLKHGFYLKKTATSNWV